LPQPHRLFPTIPKKKVLSFLIPPRPPGAERVARQFRLLAGVLFFGVRSRRSAETSYTVLKAGWCRFCHHVLMCPAGLAANSGVIVGGFNLDLLDESIEGDMFVSC